MKNLLKKLFNICQNLFEDNTQILDFHIDLTQEKIEFFLNEKFYLSKNVYHIEKINELYYVDIFSNIYAQDKKIKQIPFQIRNFSGHVIDISHNFLTDTSFLPISSGEILYVDISYNNIQTIDLQSKEILISEFNISNNQLKNLNGLSDKISALDCSYNQIDDLSGAKDVELLVANHNHMTSLKTLNGSYYQIDLSNNQINEIDFLPNILDDSIINLSENPVCLKYQIDIKDRHGLKKIHALYQQEHIERSLSLQKSDSKPKPKL